MKRLAPQEFYRQYFGLEPSPLIYVEPSKACDFAAAYADHCEESAWVSVSERLPESHADVDLYCDEFKTLIRGFIDENGRFYQVGFGQTFGITHWRPLPSPPKSINNG